MFNKVGGEGDDISEENVAEWFDRLQTPVRNGTRIKRKISGRIFFSFCACLAAIYLSFCLLFQNIIRVKRDTTEVLISP